MLQKQSPRLAAESSAIKDQVTFLLGVVVLISAFPRSTSFCLGMKSDMV